LSHRGRSWHKPDARAVALWAKTIAIVFDFVKPFGTGRDGLADVGKQNSNLGMVSKCVPGWSVGNGRQAFLQFRAINLANERSSHPRAVGGCHYGNVKHFL
jgi:hypothetical protein